MQKQKIQKTIFLQRTKITILLLLLFLPLCLVFLLSGHSEALTTTKNKLPASKEVTDHEFWKIVKQIKPEATKGATRTVETRTTVKVAEKTVFMKLAPKGLKVGGGAITVATVLAFPDDVSASPRELTDDQMGAAKYEYKKPAKNSPMYSSKHSFDKNYNQYYVRVHVASGTKANPKVKNSLPWPTQVKLSSKQRGKEDGCGKNGAFGNRWRDSSQNFNEKGWAYFPDCRKDNNFEVSFNYLPKELENARIVRTVSATGKDRLIVNLDYYIITNDDLMDDIDVKLKSKPSPSNSEDECVKNEQGANNQPVRGSHGDVGGKIDYRFPYSSKTEIYLKDVLTSRDNPQKGKLGPKCDQVRHSRDYRVYVRGDTYAGNSKRKGLQGVKVSIDFNGPGKCMGVGYSRPDTSPSDSTNANGVAEFNNCGRNNITLKLQDSKGYQYVVPVNGGSIGAKVRSQSSKGGQRVQIYVDLLKPYPDEWRKDFSQAASHYWQTRQAIRIADDEKANKSQNPFYKPIVNIRSATCQPGNVKIVLDDMGGGKYADAGIGFSDGGAKSSPGQDGCSLKFSASKGVKNVVTDRVKACIIFTHEYGHLLSYPDFGREEYGVGPGDLMYKHLLPYINQKDSKEYKRWVSDTGCAAVAKNKPFNKYQGTLAGTGSAGALKTKNKVAKFKKYNKSTKQKMAKATDDAWTRFQKNYNGGSTEIKKDSGTLRCKPKDVKITYGSFGSPNEGPKLNGYYNNMIQSGIGFAANRNADEGEKSKVWYCRMYVNTDPQYRTFTQNPRYACVLFMHAYGRMLGYQNVNDERRLMNDTINLGQIRTQASGNECGKYF